MTTILQARWVLPVGAPPIENGAVVVEGGRIVAVNRAARLGRATHDCGDALLVPGFVNAHTHLELSCYRSRIKPGPFWHWIEALIALRRMSGAADAERAAVTLGALESLRNGVTCVGDIARTGGHAAALRTVPIRKTCFVELISGASQPPNDVPSLERILDETARWQDDRLRIGVSAHAPYTVTPDDVRATLRIAGDRAMPWTLHLHETREELEWLRDGTGPTAAFLERFGLLIPRLVGTGDKAYHALFDSAPPGVRPLLAHVNYASDADLARLSRLGASVAWCPRTHRFFGHGPHRWRDMLAAGINVCVATDSLASNDTLSILDEMRFVAQADTTADGATLLEMGTLNGAEALGLGSQVGTLAPGKRADLVAVGWDLDGPADPLENLVRSRRLTQAVWIDGEPVWPVADPPP